MNYVETDIPEGVTIREYRLSRGISRPEWWLHRFYAWLVGGRG